MEQDLWFSSAVWLVWLAPFAGVLAGGLTRRKDPVVEGDRVYRHDVPARVTHWTHGIGTAMLLVSGILLGTFFTPTPLAGGSAVWRWMNVHYVFAVVFLFGTFYYGANSLLARQRFIEHLPTVSAIDYTKRHYGILLGFKGLSFPPEKKYFESEKMAYVMALVSTVVIILTGLLKVAAHSLNVPGWLLAVGTPVHDIAAAAMLAFLAAHVLFAAILPMSWPVLGSMFTGYVSLDHVRHEHAGWFEELVADVGDSADDATA